MMEFVKELCVSDMYAIKLEEIITYEYFVQYYIHEYCHLVD